MNIKFLIKRRRFLMKQKTRALENLYSKREREAAVDFEQIDSQPTENDLGAVETLLETVQDMSLIRDILDLREVDDIRDI